MEFAIVLLYILYGIVSIMVYVFATYMVVTFIGVNRVKRTFKKLFKRVGVK